MSEEALCPKLRLPSNLRERTAAGLWPQTNFVLLIATSQRCFLQTEFCLFSAVPSVGDDVTYGTGTSMAKDVDVVPSRFAAVLHSKSFSEKLRGRVPSPAPLDERGDAFTRRRATISSAVSTKPRATICSSISSVSGQSIGSISDNMAESKTPRNERQFGMFSLRRPKRVPQKPHCPQGSVLESKLAENSHPTDGFCTFDSDSSLANDSTLSDYEHMLPTRRSHSSSPSNHRLRRVPQEPPSPKHSVFQRKVAETSHPTDVSCIFDSDSSMRDNDTDSSTLSDFEHMLPTRRSHSPSPRSRRRPRPTLDALPSLPSARDLLVLTPTPSSPPAADEPSATADEPPTTSASSPKSRSLRAFTFTDKFSASERKSDQSIGPKISSRTVATTTASSASSTTATATTISSSTSESVASSRGIVARSREIFEKSSIVERVHTDYDHSPIESECKRDRDEGFPKFIFPKDPAVFGDSASQEEVDEKKAFSNSGASSPVSSDCSSNNASKSPNDKAAVKRLSGAVEENFYRAVYFSPQRQAEVEDALRSLPRGKGGKFLWFQLLIQVFLPK